MSKPVLNIDDLSYVEFGHGERFRAQRAPVSPGIGAKKLGCGVIKLAPGKRGWPYHAHHVIEEMFFILKGEGTLRHAGEEHAVRAGDFICAPADPQQPHQLINTSDAELSYIAISTMENADVVLYPDSGKYGVWHGTTRDTKAPDTFRVVARMKDAVDYWDGE
jgi:uncharacterized cupin superfamily protein